VSLIDWECEIKTLFRDENLGCGCAVSEAITWFFENVEDGIILEDDCLPTTYFFYYCQFYLRMYKYENKIFSISGCNLNYVRSFNQFDPFASKMMNMWGWATWKRSSDLVQYDLSGWSKIKYKNLFLFFKLESSFIKDLGWIKFWHSNFEFVSKNVSYTWDYQWIYTQIYKNSLTIYPPINMISNIGFNEFATHTIDKSSPVSKLTIESSMDFQFTFPLRLKDNKIFMNDFVKEKWFYYFPRITLFSVIKNFFQKKIDLRIKFS
jgi:hypothetical protein